MAKNKSRSSETSKGERRSMSKELSRAIRADRSYLDKYYFKVKAWAKGQNPWLTIANPNKNETNKLFIRVRSNDYLGNPRGNV